MISRLLTREARRRLMSLARSIAPFAERIEGRFESVLRQKSLRAAEIRACQAITPVAASRLRTLRGFLEQVEYHATRLAKLNVAAGTVRAVLRDFDEILEAEIPGQFQPAREQLQLVTVLALESAYHRVSEAESQVLFGLYRAELEASGLEDLLQRFIRLLSKALRARAGHLVQACQTEPIYIERGEPAEKSIVDPALRGRYASYWSYPLSPELVVQFAFPAPYPWLPRELALLDAAGERCREAIDRVRMQAEIRRLEAQAWHAEEEERRRIGRELHDEAGQSLLLLRMQLEMMERRAPAGLVSDLVEARGIADKTVEELRRIVAALSPAVLERLGLASALRQLAARFRKTHPAEVTVRIPAFSEPLPLPVQQVIYRVAQECLQNAVKHSQATHVNLSLIRADKNIRLSVADNGAGFSAKAAEGKPMSFGLAGMRERATILGGTLTVRSALGKGSRITLQLPQAAAQARKHVENSSTVN